MEEVKTSDNLEKEILDDARKKAERLLKNAEKKVEELAKEWDRKIAGELVLLDGEYKKRKAHAASEITAALPLEKKRRRIAYLEEIFEKRIAAVVESLSEEEIIPILVKRLKRASGLLGSYSPTVRYSGISRAGAEEIIAAGLGKKNPDLLPAEGFHGLLIEADNGHLVYRLRMEELVEDLREYRREAVISAVFKGKR
jgi:V/A-type H+-transporting ATPase subunit E